jgi:general secretion pathway protein K
MIAVFWVMSILSLAVFTSVRLLYYEFDLVTAQSHGSRARQLAEMGLAVAANPVVEEGDPILSQRFENGEGFDALIRTEGDRFNINVLLMPRSDTGEPDKPLLKDILELWNMDPDEAAEVIDALVDWVDANDFEELNGAEDGYYEDLGFLNRPYNRPFYSLDEMRLVRGWSQVERLNPNWKEWFTVWTGGGLDVNDARPDLLAMALKVSESETELIGEHVRGPDGIRYTEDDLPFQSPQEALDFLGMPDIQVAEVLPRLTANDQTSRLESIGRSGDIKRRITLILRNRTGRPAILERREEVVP